MRKVLLKLISVFILCFLTNFGVAKIIENKDYLVLEKVESADKLTSTNIEVLEFFSLGCPYCEVLETEIQAWLAEKPKDVAFKRIAIPRSGRWVEYARVFYALGMISRDEQERLLPIMYAAINQQHIDLSEPKKIFSWIEEQGIDRSIFEEHYNSDEVSNMLDRAVDLALSYNLKYVPSIYVNNKYQLILDSSNQYKHTKENLIKLVNKAR